MDTRTTKITKAYLENNLACLDDMLLFEKLFPQGVEVTEELALQHAQQFDWRWAIDHLLEGDAYRNAIDDDHQAYRAREEARDKINDAYAEKDQHTADEVRERLAALKAVKEEYKRQLAVVFARHFLAQGGRVVMESEAPSRRTMTITAAYLDHKYACPEQQRKFTALFPNGVEVIKELALQHADVFEWNWAIYTLLDAGPDKEMAKKQIDAAEAVYRRTIDPSYNVFIRDMDDLDKRTAYERVRDAARKNFNAELARLFAFYFTKQGGRPLLEGERTSGGVLLTDKVLNDLADEAERGYDITALRPRSGGALL